MSNLTSSRVTEPSRVFAHCGLDYAWPLQVRLAGGRGPKSQPCYIVLFIGLSVKAIHLELVSDYSSETFIGSYHRFCARRGIPTHLYSNRGTNFQGACRLLKENFERIVVEPEFRGLLARNNVTWHFIPPAAPHFGGIWKAGVKSVKTHLKRILFDKTPTCEELQTLLSQIEAILNSRFKKKNRLSLWQKIQQMFEIFWKRWSHDYLQLLQHRTKWRISNVKIKVG